MFAKLFSRITESSLMEEPIDVRYCFVMLLAMCDATGHVIGTDIAIARRMNMPVTDFQRCVSELMKPDAESNSKEEQGRRVVNSEGERGYFVVNYLTYREMKNQENRREYMREYMEKYRGKKESGKQKKLTVNLVKPPLARLIHAEGEAEGEEKAETDQKKRPQRGKPSVGDSVHAKFIDDWGKYFLLRTKSEYAFQGGRDGKAVQTLLLHFGEPDKAKDFIKACHARTGEGYPFGLTSTLADLANNISRLQAALATPLKLNGKHRETEADRDAAKTGLPPQEFNLKHL